MVASVQRLSHPLPNTQAWVGDSPEFIPSTVFFFIARDIYVETVYSLLYFRLDKPQRRGERDRLGIRGLLPSRVLEMDAQISRVMGHLEREESPIRKYLYLRDLHDRNETLFHREKLIACCMVLCWMTLVALHARLHYVSRSLSPSVCVCVCVYVGRGGGVLECRCGRRGDTTASCSLWAALTTLMTSYSSECFVLFALSVRCPCRSHRRTRSCCVHPDGWAGVRDVRSRLQTR